MRRTFALLMFLILASTPILDGGCFTIGQISASRKEVWNDLRPPCAAFVGGDGSLTLVLPDGDNLEKAKFFAVRFTAEEVKAVACQVKNDFGNRIFLGGAVEVAPHPPETVVFENPNSDVLAKPNDAVLIPPVANQITVTDSPQILRSAPMRTWDIRAGNAKSLKFSLKRKSARISLLPGVTESQWSAALPEQSRIGGRWLSAGTQRFPNGYASKDHPYDIFQYGRPKYQADTWEVFTDQDADVYTTCRVFREDGTHMVPTAGVFLVPVTLVADVITSPIQLVVLIGGGVDELVN